MPLRNDTIFCGAKAFERTAAGCTGADIPKLVEGNCAEYFAGLKYVLKNSEAIVSYSYNSA